MALKNYFKSFSSADPNEIEYIIVFKNISKPNIKDFPSLLELGRWNYYSDNGFCLFCKVSKDELVNLIKKETGISIDNFLVAQRNQFLGVGY